MTLIGFLLRWRFLSIGPKRYIADIIPFICSRLTSEFNWASYICDTFYLRFQQKKPSTFGFIRRVRLLSSELGMPIRLPCALGFHYLHQTSYNRMYFQLHWVVRFNMYNCSEETVHSVTRLPRSAILKRTAYRMQNYAFKWRSVSQKIHQECQ
jgi:hypothetical protein